MNVQDIRTHVTYFSEELKLKAVQEEDVVVGGVIQTIVPPVNSEYPMYILALDDKVGISYVAVPENMMTHYGEELQAGNLVFLEGFVNVVKHNDQKDVTIFAYSMKDITKIGDTI